MVQDDHSDFDTQLSAYDFHLPLHSIAQTATEPRDASKLLVYDRKIDSITHRYFRDIGEFLVPGDLLVRNVSRVIPARVLIPEEQRKPLEILFLHPIRKTDSANEHENNSTEKWSVLAKPAKRLSLGTRIDLPGGTVAQVIECKDRGERILQLQLPIGKNCVEWLQQVGVPPLPPYIRRKADQHDVERYQTVYATSAGSVAAPTAGLHFTEKLIQQLEQRGVEFADVTLHVGPGTFQPVEVEDIRDFKIHSEWIECSSRTIEQVQSAKREGRRVICVGTTATRTLEYIARKSMDDSTEVADWCDIFIRPGDPFLWVDGMITNFHLPKSSLLMLVSALLGREKVLSIYRTAIEQGYRFYSYGDACLFI